jgi:hypothetical protein
MLSAISLGIYEFRKYLVLSLMISLIAIPICDAMVIQRDRNRNEMYGEGFWIYGFSIYQMNDRELAEALPPGWGFNDGNHVLPEYLENVNYEYPVFGLVFFAIATWLYPGTGGLQPLWLNFLLVLVFNLNLVLIAILLREKLYKANWARLFFGGYFAYGLLMSAGGGKLEPIVDCLLLMALVLWRENQNGKAMFTLGLSVQTKVYTAVAFPLMFIANPLSSVWFIASMAMTVIPVFFGADFGSLISHIFNLSSYSAYIVNPLYPILGFATPELVDNVVVSSYAWPPALIPLTIYVFFMLSTIRKYIPEKSEFAGKSLRMKLYTLKPFYLYLLPGVLFIFRWVMPWYLYWLAPLVVLFERNDRARGYLKQVTLVGLLYTLGLVANWPYFWTNPLPQFVEHFPYGLWTIGGLVLLMLMTALAFLVWKWVFSHQSRLERKEAERRAAEISGELII